MLDGLERIEARIDLEIALNNLTPREKTIVIKTVLEDDTLTSVAKSFGISGNRVRQIKEKALRKLKHPKNNLRSYKE